MVKSNNLQDVADHSKIVEGIEADIRPVRLAYVKLKRHLEATAAKHQVSDFLNNLPWRYTEPL